MVAAAVDKGAGLAALARLLGEPGAPAAVRLAVGDTAADLPMLALAEHAFAPANATADVRRAGVEALRQPYAAGVAAAAARVLGHPPGGCPLPPRPTSLRHPVAADDARRTRAGRAGLPAAAVRLAAELAGLRQPSR